MRVPLLDLRAQHSAIRAEVERVVAEIFDEQQFVLGARVEAFERAMESYSGARHAIGVASGSDALLLALSALGVGRGDTVVTTPFTFFATASAASRVGARILFADIEADTFNLSAATIEKALERGPVEGRVVFIPVHLYGRLAPMEEILALARRVGAGVVEDAAQSVGARARVDRAVRSAGAIAELGALSFFPSKNLGAAGDAGMVLSQNDELAERIRVLRVHGSRRRYHHELVGMNSRLDAIQAAVLSVKLRHVDEWNARRRDRAALYGRRLREWGLAAESGPIRTPGEPGAAHVFHLYVVRAERRDALREALEAAGIDSQIYYPVPLHLQPCFADLGHRDGDFPESERAGTEVLALPLYPELTDEQVEHVVATIGAFYGRRRP